MGTEPARVGRYQLVDQLAVGGMAQLFLARVTGAHGFEKPVVIKKILPHMAMDRAFRAMFIDEAKIVARLQHPKIVQVLELGTEADELFIVMEYVEGRDVLHLIKRTVRGRRRLPLELAVHITHEIADALDFAHGARGDDGEPLGIVHRDISPGNVLVSRRGDVKLTDFGIARAAHRIQKTETGTLKGKFSYMSPEQVAGKELDARSDIFSTAVVLAEMLIGRHLFSSPNDLDILLMVRDARLDRLDSHGRHIPAELRAILDRALARRPDDRYQTAAEFREALADWMFASGKRVGARHLAALVQACDRDPDQELPESLSGPETQHKQLAAEEQARVARALFARGQTSRPAEPAADPVAETEIDIVIDEEAPQSEVPTEEGSLRDQPPMAMLFRLAVGQHTGRLMVQQDDVIKEAYVDLGHPVFVRSNVITERLGEYLVARRVISRDELQRALGVLPHFGGRLGDTLVGLGLMQPMDAVRFLAAQVRDKLVDACTWRDGRYRWYRGERNPWPAVALHLDTYEIIGRGAAAIDGALLERWGLQLANRRPMTSLPRIDLSVFQLGDRPRRVFNSLDGARTVGELAMHYASGEQRQEFLRMLYLLANCRMVRLG
ncbi:MAG TPA: protein kinase [Kofleriaceae bacterium]|nr:protein kinase [Kofleriaceae bacterium]